MHMKHFIRHPEFPAFRHQLAPMKAARSRLAGHRRLHALDAAAGKFLPGGILHELGQWPGTRSRWLPLPLIFWAFLSMVLNPGTPCREAQRSVQAWWKRLGRLWQSTGTNAFCMARSRLPLDWLRRLWWRMADGIAAAAPELPGCHGRRVLVVDGTIIQTPDTAQSQQVWPQPSSQKPGCGFPHILVVALFCLRSGALLRAVHGALKSHEARLFALLRRFLKRGDILVGDRGFWSFPNLALLKARGVDAIFRARYANRIDWRRGRRLGKGDRLVTMKKSVDPSRVMGRRLWTGLPKEITMRQVRGQVERKGHRSGSFVITTTLLDPVAWPAERLLALYVRRWRVELCFDDLKTTMKAETMRCQSPDMVRRELLLHAIAYNLVRRIMLESAQCAGAPLDRMSFKGTLDTLRQWQDTVAGQRAGALRNKALYEMLLLCGLDEVPERPGRTEPRCLKKRPKPYQILTSPRRLMKTAPSRRHKGKQKPSTAPAKLHKSWA